MLEVEYIETIRKHLAFSKYTIEATELIADQKLELVARKNTKFPLPKWFFFVAIFDYLDFQTLDSFSYGCRQHVVNSFRKGFLNKVFPPNPVAYVLVIAITNNTESNLVEAISNSYPRPDHNMPNIIDFPVCVLPVSEKLYFPIHPTPWESKTEEILPGGYDYGYRLMLDEVNNILEPFSLGQKANQ